MGSAAKCKEKLHLNVAVNFLSFILEQNYYVSDVSRALKY